jgi:hypothetical protein
MKRLLVPAVFAASLVFATGAHAQQPPQQDAATRDAMARFNEGLALHDQGKDEDARTKFLQAYAIVKRPSILFNLARSEQLSGARSRRDPPLGGAAAEPEPRGVDG